MCERDCGFQLCVHTQTPNIIISSVIYVYYGSFFSPSIFRFCYDCGDFDLKLLHTFAKPPINYTLISAFPFSCWTLFCRCWMNSRKFRVRHIWLGIDDDPHINGRRNRSRWSMSNQYLSSRSLLNFTKQQKNTHRVNNYMHEMGFFTSLYNTHRNWDSQSASTW